MKLKLGGRRADVSRVHEGVCEVHVRRQVRHGSALCEVDVSAIIKQSVAIVFGGNLHISTDKIRLRPHSHRISTLKLNTYQEHGRNRECKRQLRERRQPEMHTIARPQGNVLGKKVHARAKCIVIRRHTYKVWIALVASPHTVQMLE